MCLFQPKSTSTVVIGKTANNIEDQDSVAAKDEDTEDEWVEQKTDLKKLPRQYMQLSKIRLTGMSECCYSCYLTLSITSWGY